MDTLGRATVMMATGSKPVPLSAVSVKGLDPSLDTAHAQSGLPPPAAAAEVVVATTVQRQLADDEKRNASFVKVMGSAVDALELPPGGGIDTVQKIQSLLESRAAAYNLKVMQTPGTAPLPPVPKIQRAFVRIRPSDQRKFIDLQFSNQLDAQTLLRSRHRYATKTPAGLSDLQMGNVLSSLQYSYRTLCKGLASNLDPTTDYLYWDAHRCYRGKVRPEDRTRYRNEIRPSIPQLATLGARLVRT